MSTEEPSVDDLLGDEALPLDPPPLSERTPLGRRLPPRGVLVGVGVVIFALLWLLSSLHHDRFYLEVDGDMVRVQRGWYFPIGSSEWVPSRAYKPFRLPPGISPDETGSMTAAEVDAQLMKLFRRIAEREVSDLREGDAELAEDMLFRANKLLHTDIEDERELMRMLGDVHFHQGLRTLREVNESFEEALRQFQLSAMRGGNRYKTAPEWVEAIQRFQKDFRSLAKESGLDLDSPIADPHSVGDALKAVTPVVPSGAPASAQE